MERDDPISIAGRIVAAGCLSSPIAGVRVTLDARYTSVTDGEGRYGFARVVSTDSAGLRGGEHILVAVAPAFRAKAIRQTAQSLAQRVRSDRSTPPCAVVDFAMQRTSEPACGRSAVRNSIDAVDTTAGEVIDEDGDGIDDVVEDWMAWRFAPIVFHGQNETNYPVTVDWLLQRTSLHEFDADARPRINREVLRRPRQADLLGRRFSDTRGAVSSSGTHSVCKNRTFFLADADPSERAGQRDAPQEWVTYVHSYGNRSGGITLTYWRCYAYNQARFLFTDWSHGGDWEAVAVHLNTELQPESISFLGHRGIDRLTRQVQWEGEHPRVWSQEGGHASTAGSAGMKSSRFIRQETWAGGRVTWWDGSDRGAGAGLVNVGEKGRPRNGQVFIQYSGMWGSPHLWFLTSGYWGPAFNDTSAQCETGGPAYGYGLFCTIEPSRCGRIFHTAWCDGMDGNLLDLDRECRAESSSR